MICGKNQGSLLTACKRGDTAAVSRLVQDGADTECSDGSGKTALLRAAKYGHLETCKLLLRSNANIYACSTDGRTVMHMAVLSGNVALVKELMLAIGGTNLLQAKDKLGRTPGQLAAQTKATSIAQLLEAKVSDRNEHAQRIQVDSTSPPAPSPPTRPVQTLSTSGSGPAPASGPQRVPTVVPTPGQQRVPMVVPTPAPHRVPTVVPSPAPQRAPLVVPTPMTGAGFPLHAGPPSARHAGPPGQVPRSMTGPMRVPVPGAVPDPSGASELVSAPNLRPINTQPRRSNTPASGLPGAPSNQPRVVPTIPAQRTPKGGPVCTPQASRNPRSAPLTPKGVAHRPTPGVTLRTPVAPAGTPSGPDGEPAMLGAMGHGLPATPVGRSVTPRADGDGTGTDDHIDNGFPADVEDDADLDKETGKAHDPDEDGALIDDSLVLEDQKAQAQAEFDAVVGASLAAATEGRRGRWTKVEVTADDYLLIVSGAIDLLDEIEADCENLSLSKCKCKQLAARVEALRPILQALQQKLESGGPDALSAAGDKIQDVVTDFYDVVDNVQQYIHEWVGCTMGDFGVLVTVLTSEELNIGFTGLHCEVDDLMEMVEPVLDALRVPTDELPKTWEDAFDVADQADRDTLIANALTIVKGSADAAAAVHKLMFESALSAEELMLILVEHNIPTDGLTEFTAVVEEAGALREAAWGEKQQEQQHQDSNEHDGDAVDNRNPTVQQDPEMPRYPVINPAAHQCEGAREKLKNDADKC